MTIRDLMINVPEENRSRVEELLSQRKDLQKMFEELGNTYADQEAYDRLYMDMDRIDRELRSLGYVRK
jgi:hypothetical protein